MLNTTFANELAALGPSAAAARTFTLDEARAYCRQLARSHYENFTVASWLLPGELRPHFYNVYAYCRWSDDLADETADPAAALKLLDWWQGELEACYAGEARHPVFVALKDTIREFAIPIEPFADLLAAFRQDQHVRRYETFEDLLGYCQHSADPVGRLVLHLGRCHDEDRGELSDRICTGLQLANFWQDVARDYDKGRVYLPRETLRRFGYDEWMLESRVYNDQFRHAMAHEVARAEEWLTSGLGLVDKMPPKLRGDVWLFAHGGLKILAHVRALDYDVWSRRPEVSKLEKFGLLWGYLRLRWQKR
jgi:squalene synthase HpnC